MLKDNQYWYWKIKTSDDDDDDERLVFVGLYRTILRGMNEIQHLTEMVLGNSSQFVLDSIDGTMDVVITVLDAMRGTEWPFFGVNFTICICNFG